jgi:transposase
MSVSQGYPGSFECETRRRTQMRFYTVKHKHVCGIDLHARSLYLCVVDHESEQPLLHKNIRAEPAAFLDAIAPFREDLVVGCEATFPWYWVSDLCVDSSIPFVLGHPLYMRAIHGAKVKNDRVDSNKVALLLRSGMFPLAYAYPRAWRATRDLLRRRSFFMRKRAELLVHVVNTNSQYNLPPLAAKLTFAANRAGVAESFDDPAVQKSVATDLTLIAHYDDVLRDLELTIIRSAREHAPQQLHLLRTVPGIGKILALNILYEVGDIRRFETVAHFVSYCRLIRPDHTSAGKHLGFGPKKIGNAHLRWSFGEAAAGFPRNNPTGKRVVERLKRKHDKNTMNVLAHKLGRAVYFMLRRNEAFDMNRLMS